MRFQLIKGNHVFLNKYDIVNGSVTSNNTFCSFELKSSWIGIISARIDSMFIFSSNEGFESNL